MTGPIMQAGDVTDAAALAIALLSSEVDSDPATWSVQAGDLDWSCQRTLDHIVDTMLLYGSYLATRATDRREPFRDGNPAATVPQLLDALDASARMLELVCVASSPPVRAFHPSGYADADGYRAMACSEILTHTDDIARGMGLSWHPPDALCERIMRRVFPWGPDAAECPDRWDAVRWACGRIALPTRAQLDDRWWWWSAPLDEWDETTRHARTAPPAWS